jgi:hypothetical protein
MMNGQVFEDDSFTTDGKEILMKTDQAEGITKGRWEGTTLVIDYKLKLINGLTLIKQDKMTLSEDGKILIIVQHYSTEAGDRHTKLILERQ